jgi:hypothetical protein
LRHAVAKEDVLGHMSEQRRFRRRGLFYLNVLRDGDLADGLPNLHQLRRAGGGMGFQLAPLRPAVSRVVVIHIAEKQARFRAVDNEADVRVHPYGQEILVFRLVQLVELHPRTGRIHLQIKGRCLDGLLLLARETGKAVGEGIGNSEIH